MKNYTYYDFWYIDGDSWKDFPEIPHCEKFIHNHGTAQLIENEEMRKVSLGHKFSNDK